MLLCTIEDNVGEMVNGRLPSFVDGIVEQGQFIAFAIAQCVISHFDGEPTAEFEQRGISLFREALHMLLVMVGM